MASYYWDLGFDFNAVQINGFSYLQNGFVLYDPVKSVGSPATPVNLATGDTINFSVFNLTNPRSAGTYSIAGGSITFQAAITQQASISPFNVSGDPSDTPCTWLSFPLKLNPDATEASAIFSGAQVSGQNPTTFPRYNYPVGLQVANIGFFLMSVRLQVLGPNSSGGFQQRTFIVDPEMVIGSVG